MLFLKGSLFIAPTIVVISPFKIYSLLLKPSMRNSSSISITFLLYNQPSSYTFKHIKVHSLTHLSPTSIYWSSHIWHYIHHRVIPSGKNVLWFTFRRKNGDKRGSIKPPCLKLSFARSIKFWLKGKCWEYFCGSWRSHKRWKHIILLLLISSPSIYFETYSSRWFIIFKR